MTHTLHFFLFMIVLYCGALLAHLGGRSKVAENLLAAGALMNGVFLIQHSVITGVFVVNALVDQVFFIPFMMALVLLILLKKKNLPSKTMNAAFLLLIAAALFAACYPKGIIPPAPNKGGAWAFLFFLSENGAYVCFGLSAAIAVFSSLDKHAAATVRQLVVMGFLLFSFAQVTGAMWSFLGWGHPFMWGGRHLSSAAVWLMYIALIHIRYQPSFVIKERWLTLAGGLLAMAIVYSHLVLEMGIHRIGA